MDYPRKSSPLSTLSSCSDIWSISFGDLLTLLVCFFLVLTPRSSKSPENLSPKQEVMTSSGMSLTTGTNIASAEYERADEKGRLLRIVKKGFVADAAEVNVPRDGRSIIKDDRPTLGNEGRVTVRLCSHSLTQQDVSQILFEVHESGQKLSDVQFEVGASCAQWRDESAPADALLAVVNYRGE